LLTQDTIRFPEFVILTISIYSVFKLPILKIYKAAYTKASNR
jgi:hypothetical protein